MYGNGLSDIKSNAVSSLPNLDTNLIEFRLNIDSQISHMDGGWQLKIKIKCCFHLRKFISGK